MAIRELKSWAKTFDVALPTYQSLLTDLTCRLEQLPISADYTIKHPVGIVLIGQEWYQVTVLNELDDGWAEWSVPTQTGTDSGLAQPYKWAHCTADNTPHIP